MGDIESVIRRIRNLYAYGLGVAEIRECLAPSPEEEGAFYLAFIAAQIADRPFNPERGGSRVDGA